MINIENILEEIRTIPLYQDLADKTNYSKNKEFYRGFQIPLQGIKDVSKEFNPLTYGVGRMDDLQHEESDFTDFIYELPYTNGVIKECNMFRTRLMVLRPKACYFYHSDGTKRIHIPLITDPDCFFVIEDEVYRFPADGTWSIVDTTKMHTAINASRINRYHIVGCIKEN